MPRTEVGEWLEAPVVVAYIAAAGATATSASTAAASSTTPASSAAVATETVEAPAVVAAVENTALGLFGPGRRKRPFRYPER